MSRTAGRHFLQIPGPTNVPDRILRAMDRPTIDHRGPSFAEFARRVLDGLRPVFGCDGPVFVYPASGSGGWEAALVNTLSPGDRVLMCETGHFALQWSKIATRIGLQAELLPGDWRSGADPDAVGARLKEDAAHEIRAVCVVHNETSTACVSPVAEIRQAMDDADHPALLMVDTVSSLGAMPYHADDWGVDVTVCGSQKGLMLPPGLAFNAVSGKAMAASQSARLPRSYWSWDDMREMNARGFFPYTPATNLLYGLAEALDMLEEEGLPAVWARHRRHAEATRAAVKAWRLEMQCAQPDHASPALTAVRMPEEHSADAFRALVLDRFDMSLGNGLSKLADRVFRIGHLGDLNDLTLIGTLSGVEMGLELADIPFRRGGVQAAMDVLSAPEHGSAASAHVAQTTGAAP